MAGRPTQGLDINRVGTVALLIFAAQNNPTLNPMKVDQMALLLFEGIKLPTRDLSEGNDEAEKAFDFQLKTMFTVYNIYKMFSMRKKTPFIYNNKNCFDYHNGAEVIRFL